MPCPCRAHVAPMPFPCRAHAVPLPCRAAKGLEFVFPIWFTQCGRVWFTLATPCSDHVVLLKATAQHGRPETAVLCHSKPLAARHGMGTPWARHAMCESAFNLCFQLCCKNFPGCRVSRRWAPSLCISYKPMNTLHLNICPFACLTPSCSPHSPFLSH
jgi:hypothetical protein